MIRNFILATSLGLLLGGCATVTNPISATQVYDLENAYGVVQSLAAGYASEQFCPKGTTISQSILKFCAIPSAVIEIHTADINARAVLRVAETFVRDNPTLSASSVISAAQKAIALASQIESSYGLKTK